MTFLSSRFENFAISRTLEIHKHIQHNWHTSKTTKTYSEQFEKPKTTETAWRTSETPQSETIPD